MEAPRLHAGLVLIHGAGKEPSGYYRGFLTAVGRHLGVEPVVLPAWWADLCNLGVEVKGAGEAGAPAAAGLPLSKEAEAFRRDYLRELGVGVRGAPAEGAAGQKAGARHGPVGGRHAGEPGRYGQ